MQPSPQFAVAATFSVRLETSRTVLFVAGAVVVIILLLLAARAVLPAVGAGVLATAALPSPGPQASEYTGQGTSHGFRLPTGS